MFLTSPKPRPKRYLRRCSNCERLFWAVTTLPPLFCSAPQCISAKVAREWDRP